MPNFSIPLSGWTPIPARPGPLPPTIWPTWNHHRLQRPADRIRRSVLSKSRTDGAGRSIQQGAGVQVSSQLPTLRRATCRPPASDTEWPSMAMGFFVVEENGVQSYTRAGNFEIGTNNLLETAGGSTVMGYPATNGVVKHQRGTEHARTRSRKPAVRPPPPPAKPTDDTKPQCHRGRGLRPISTTPPSTIPSAPSPTSR